jgi:hypothetical protein
MQSMVSPFSLVPSLPSHEYLATQHLHFGVRVEQLNKLKQSSMEVIAEGSIALSQVLNCEEICLISDIHLMSKGIREGTAFVKMSMSWSDFQPQRAMENIVKQGKG